MIEKRRFEATDLALVAVFAALIAALAIVPGFNIGVVPITLQTLGVMLTGLCLGPVRGFLATLLYLVVGFVGLPVFAGGAAGLGVLAKASAGYLLSFPLAALTAGLVAVTLLRRRSLNPLWLFLAAMCGSLIFVHPMGIAGLMTNAHMPFAKAFSVDMAFWPGDLIKNFAACLIAASVHKAFPALLLGGVRRDVTADTEAPAAA